MKQFHITRDARFTEEVFKSGDVDKKSDFDIYLNKDCSKGNHASEDYVNGTNLCYHCYYSELAEMMTDKYKIRPSKRLDFVRYQMDLRDDPLTFLAELEELVIDNEAYFDDADYGLHRKYLTIIKALRDRLNTGFKDKVEAAIRILQLNRGEPENHSLGYLLRLSGYRVVADDEPLIAQELEERGLITYFSTKDGVFAKLTAKGIAYEECQIPEEEQQELTPAELLKAITDYLDLKFADTNVLVAQTGKELADVIEELDEMIGGGAKEPISKLIRAKLSDLILTETIKREGVHPLLDWAKDVIKELPSG